jgi:hypothetical protein
MKKKHSKKLPAAKRESVDVPEIDFSKYRLRPNRFAKLIEAEGIELVHDGPSPASLQDLPEADFKKLRVRRNPYAARLGAAGVTIHTSRGRPARGSEVGPTVLKSVRLPPLVWAQLEKRARAKGIAVHALVRQAILDLLKRVA